MNMDSIKELLNNFDLGNFLPEINTIMGWVTILLRLAVMAGPVIILALGLIYLVAPPKEANHRFGFRCYFGMGSVEAWLFTQRLAGIVLGALGLVLTIIMALICNGWNNLEPMDMVWSAVSCLLWELGLVGVSCLGVNITVMAVFDKDGFRRKDYK